ncbi:hypothetical protein [Sphaerochaeta sp. PS]|uniref:hypothetical protein n=1 Tax=Sphaerochaeta sp. PS TaxID=3076336 RepID=UPI0028A475C7|nr:hypothetical protein [Sphaerochaeta sp. PS]MDT4762084.1 hypothetical protein [Sphaerochaeta sp. PS]
MDTRKIAIVVMLLVVVTTGAFAASDTALQGNLAGRTFGRGSNLSAVTPAPDAMRYAFLSEAGLPPWAGQGQRLNQQATYEGRMQMAQGRQPLMQHMGAQGMQSLPQPMGQGRQGNQPGNGRRR